MWTAARRKEENGGKFALFPLLSFLPFLPANFW
jgi:hypothetical protein